MSEPDIVHESSIGDYSEGFAWQIRRNPVVCVWLEQTACPHAIATAKRDYYAVPYTVVARNEGGYDSTAVCLDCIFEAAIKAGIIKGVVR
jgi:hypothetical protein